MAILPERMNKLDTDNTKESLTMLEAYIRYMAERIEFGFSTVTRKVNGVDERVEKLERKNEETSTEQGG